jgi:hypothetical protein
MSKYFKRFNDMTWPLVNEHTQMLSNNLRYHPELLTKSEQLVLCTIVDSYFQLVQCSQTKRNKVCKEVSVGDL